LSVALYKFYLYLYYTARLLWTNEGSKRVIPRKDVPLGA